MLRPKCRWKTLPLNLMNKLSSNLERVVINSKRVSHQRLPAWIRNRAPTTHSCTFQQLWISLTPKIKSLVTLNKSIWLSRKLTWNKMSNYKWTHRPNGTNLLANLRAKLTSQVNSTLSMASMRSLSWLKMSVLPVNCLGLSDRLLFGSKKARTMPTIKEWMQVTSPSVRLSLSSHQPTRKKRTLS